MKGVWQSNLIVYPNRILISMTAYQWNIFSRIIISDTKITVTNNVRSDCYQHVFSSRYSILFIHFFFNDTIIIYVTFIVIRMLLLLLNYSIALFKFLKWTEIRRAYYVYVYDNTCHIFIQWLSSKFQLLIIFFSILPHIGFFRMFRCKII